MCVTVLFYRQWINDSLLGLTSAHTQRDRGRDKVPLSINPQLFCSLSASSLVAASIIGTQQIALQLQSPSLSRKISVNARASNRRHKMRKYRRSISSEIILPLTPKVWKQNRLRWYIFSLFSLAVFCLSRRQTSIQRKQSNGVDFVVILVVFTSSVSITCKFQLQCNDSANDFVYQSL